MKLKTLIIIFTAIIFITQNSVKAEKNSNGFNRILLELHDIRNDKSSSIDISNYWGNENFSLTDNELELKIIGGLNREKDGFRGDFFVKDISVPAKDRAIAAKIVIEVPGMDWNWWYDPNASTACELNKRYFIIDYKGLDNDKSHYKGPGRVVSYEPYFEVDSLGIKERAISIYPYGCISNTTSKQAAVLGFPMNKPRVVRVTFTQRKTFGQLCLELDLGLSPATDKFPSTNDFSFFFKQMKGGGDFRSATQLYYKRYPEFFKPRTSKQGIWTLWMPEDKVFAPWDFQIGWNQVEINYDLTNPEIKCSWQKPTYAYTEPWGYYLLFPSKKGYTKSEVASADIKKELNDASKASPEAIDNYIRGVKMRESAQAVMNSAICVDPAGNWKAKHWAGFGISSESDPKKIMEKYGYLHYSMVLCNPDLDLPVPNRGKLSLERELGRIKQKDIQGIQLDSFCAFAGMLSDNYRRSHWKYADIPLTFSTRNKVPVQLHYFACIEYLRDMRKWCDKNNKLIGANIYWPWTTFTAPMLDSIGCGESSILLNLNRWFLNLRTLAPKKMISILDYQFLTWNGNKADYEKEFSARMEKGLLYAVFPGTGDGWNDSARVERARALYRKYIPLYTCIAQAGWEPLTLASTDSKACLIERYGNFNAGSMYLVIRNFKKNDKINVKINAEVPGKADLEIWDMKKVKQISCSTNTDGSFSFEAPVKQFETGCFKVCSEKDRKIFALNEVKQYLNNIVRLIDGKVFWAKEPDAIYIREELGGKFGRQISSLDTFKATQKLIISTENVLKQAPNGRSTEAAKWYLFKIKQYLLLLGTKKK